MIAFEFIFCATSWIGLNQVKSYLIWKHCILGSVVDPNYNNSHPEPAPDLNLTVQYLSEKNLTLKKFVPLFFLSLALKLKKTRNIHLKRFSTNL